MKWILQNNRVISINIFKYVIDWEKKAPSKGAQHCKDFFAKHAKQYVWLEEFLIPRTRLRCDFVNTSLSIACEFDGIQHNKYSQHFHRNLYGFRASMRRDNLKDEHLERNGFTLVRITDEDLPLTRDWFEKEYDIYL